MSTESTNFYQTLFDKSCEGLVVVGDKGKIELVNPRLLKLFKFETKEDVIGKSIEVLIPKKYHDKHVGYRDSYLNKPENRPMGIGKVLYGQKADGSEFPVEVSLSPFVDNEGNKKVIGFVSDITERVKIYNELKDLNNELETIVERRSAELKLSNKLYESIAKNFPNGVIYIFDKDFNYLFAQGKELSNRGFSGEKLIGRNYFQMLKKDLREIVQQELEKVFNNEEVSFEINYNEAVFNVQGVPLSNDHDEIDQILVVESNITKEKEIQKEIERSLEKEKELNALKSRFITLVSHEFRTPLSAIKSSSELIHMYANKGEIEKQEKHTSRIQKSVNHLNQMIEDVLSLSKIEEGIISVNPKKIDLATILTEIITEFEETNRGRTLKYSFDSTPVKTDLKLIKHIFQNIIGNAFKYTPEGKKILVNIEDKGNNIEVEISDEGIGIPKDDQGKLFERFHRANNVANIKGTGLGLNIVKKYLDEINGSISFKSAENKGTTFRITIPKEI